MKKPIATLSVFLLLILMFTVSASATRPNQVSGFFYNLPPPPPEPQPDPYTYCFATHDPGDPWVPDGFLIGCVEQPVKPGLAQRGTVELSVDTGSGILTGFCEYNLRTYDLDGIARFVANRCSGDLAGFHLKGVGWAFGPKAGTWEGSYHFHPE